MKIAGTVLVLTFAIALFAASAHAQVAGGMGGMGGGFGGHHRQQGRTKPAEAPKPKVDEKAYNAALKGLPDKQYDAWHGVR
jgi:hypothetical protein